MNTEELVKELVEAALEYQDTVQWWFSLPSRQIKTHNEADKLQKADDRLRKALKAMKTA